MDGKDALIKGIVARQKRENARYERQLQRRLREARSFAATIPPVFRKVDPAIRKIVLFGSLTTGDVKRPDFDIDLAVDSDKYLKLVAWALEQPWPVDVIDLSAVDEHFKREIEAQGMVLYEAER
jgi:predicted nucleotidyltransferase